MAVKARGFDRKQAVKIGKRIQEARLEIGMSQVELGHLLGVTDRSIQAYEQGNTIPFKFGADLERILGKPQAWFWHGEKATSVKDKQYDEILAELQAVKAELAKLQRAVGKLGRVLTPA